MSRSNDTNQKNPAKLYIKWKGEIGFTETPTGIVKIDTHKFSYYDKEKKDTECKGHVDLSLPITFLVLDVLHTITGYSEANEDGFYSNEIRTDMFKTTPFRVRCGKEDFATGLYADIKDVVKSAGGKYCQSVYVLMKHDGQWVIANFKMTGASFITWFDFCKKENIMKCAVTVKDWVVGEKGTNRYNMPVFKAMPVSDETNKIAIEKDAELQAYLEMYFKKQSSTTTPTEVKHEAEQEMHTESLDGNAPPIEAEEQNLPF